ncbi:MAG: hypothetical protein MPJ25_00425 [Pirellulales bacterium]|nr:hypothetical protein [Pirellulales bacterium]
MEKTKKTVTAPPKWESKNRAYILKGGKSPLTYFVKSRGFIWWDEERGYNRELRYAINQKSLFVDEQDENVRLGHIVFEDGALYVPKTNPLLQQLMSYYHPDAGVKWEEFDPRQETEDEVDTVEMQLEAMNLVQDLEIDHLEAIMRTELGSSVTKLTSKELKRDAFRFAKSNPKLFMEVAGDEDIKLRNLANRAVEAKLITLAENGTVFKFPNGKKIMTVPFDQHPYAALSQFFKTDDGVALMKSLLKKLS